MIVCQYENKDFLVGNVDRYTIVIWMEGDDPDCVDAIIGGSVQFSMSIDADYDDHTSLLWKYVKDIKDTLVQDKPISAAGNEAPNGSYYPIARFTLGYEKKQIKAGVSSISMERRKRESDISGATTTIYIQKETSKRKTDASVIRHCHEMITSLDTVEANTLRTGPGGSMI